MTGSCISGALGFVKAASERNSATFSTPAPLEALTSATGAPSCIASSTVSTSPPRRSRSSAMFRITSVGSPRLSIGAARNRWRLRLVESRISRTASGGRRSFIVPRGRRA